MSQVQDHHVCLNVQSIVRSIKLTFITRLFYSKRFYTLLPHKEQPEAERLTAEDFRVLGSLSPVLQVSCCIVVVKRSDTKRH